MKNKLRSILSQSAINNLYHLPKSVLANLLHGFPGNDFTIIGVTGTDGKTTTTNMIYQILKLSGKKVSMVSTVNAIVGGKTYDTGFHVTSPDPFKVQSFAKQAKKAGDEYLVLEVTSHGLDQHRFRGVRFSVGVITNITHEHLDYHKSFDNYFNTKVNLLKKVKFAIVNQNLREAIKGRTKGKIITFGLNGGDFNQKEIKLKLKTPGDYNIENALAALACAFVLDIDRLVAQRILERFEGLTGRMEEVKNNKGLRVIIDYAHTPNGLKQALNSLKSQKKGRLISIIGAEGFRDEQKRAMMGEIAQKLSDICIVAPVDPRGQLEAINKQIAEGAKRAGARIGQNFFIINGRQTAINFAVRELARKGDTIGIFGKGHENSMNLDGKSELPWSDKEAIEQALHGQQV